ncbi:hypothetical protein EJP617_16640 [Erwinia sp. Ejp617]|nr:hypothetical protein EJP617_16640 [Erwinia sp. Ejp617]
MLRGRLMVGWLLLVWEMAETHNRQLSVVPPRRSNIIVPASR